METDDGSGNFTDPFRCRLNLLVPTGKRRLLRKILSPLMQWIDPSFQVINIIENRPSGLHSRSATIHSTEMEYIKTPSISVLLFLSENGIICAKEGQEFLKGRPWKYHHKIELISRISPDRAVACQEFYGISDDMPLWSVCPIHCGNEHFRILIHVRNFKKMVEFYRVMMDVEMESNKPGFCIFQLYVQPGLDFQLALKYSQYVEPYPLDNANLVFKVKNLETVESYLQCTLTRTENSMYSVRDPDGNTVYLCEEKTSKVESNDILQTKSSDLKSNHEDLKSFRSSSDSHDSGRCSDSEIWLSESEQIKGETNYCLVNNINPVNINKYSTFEDLPSSFKRTDNYPITDPCRKTGVKERSSELNSGVMYI